MNQFAGHFLFSQSRRLRNLPYWNNLSLFFLVTLFMSLHYSVVAQDYNDLLKTADDYYNNEQYHTAAQYYQVAVGLQPTNPQTNYHLAACYRAIFDYTLAANYYRKAMELDEATFPLASFYLAQMQKSMGNFKSARDGFEHFIETNRSSSLIPAEQRAAFIAQAEIELEGSVWAIEQLGKSWRDMGFHIMPEPVNSAFNDYAAVSSSISETITITSGRKGARGSLVDNRFGDYFTDNFRYRKQNDQWVQESIADHFDRTNTKFSDGVGTYNSSGDKYYFTSCYEGSAFCKLYVTYREKGVWKNPRLLNENVNAPGYDNKHPTLTAGGDTLIFVSNRPGGTGGNDLWFSVSKNGENWETPQPLPGQINTPFNEASPFCYGDNLLFFSSDGHAGIGSMDIFMAEAYNSPQSTTIQNLGTPFNSGYDDSFFSLGMGVGFLSSNRPGGQGKFDIYAFNLPGQTEDLAEYLEETAEGTHLRSRIRNNDGSNLYAARDEDQFYYDNMTEEERQKLERILSMKQNNQDNFNPADLSSDDYKYYKKLDIGTKATIERLAVKRMLEGQLSTSHMTPQEKLDWEFYHSVHEDERAIIDRLINISVEARRRAVSNLDSEEKLYTNDPSNQERITSKLQLQSLNAQAALLTEQQRQGAEKFNRNKAILTSSEESGSGSNEGYAWQRSQEYIASVEALGEQHLDHYLALTPRQRNDLHQSAVREYIVATKNQLNDEQKQQLLAQYFLESDPLNPDAEQPATLDQREILMLRDALTSYIADEQLSGNYPSVNTMVKQEMEAQQLILQQELQQLTSKEIQTRELQEQVEQYIGEQDPADNPALEQKVVQEYYAQTQLLLPLLTPRESNYLKSLDPGRQLRIDRLARMVEIQTLEYLAYESVDQEIPEGAIDPATATPDGQVNDTTKSTLQKPTDKNLPAGKLAPKDSGDHIAQQSRTLGNHIKPEYDRTTDMAHPGISIYFDFNHYALRTEAKKTLNDLIEFLNNRGQPVKVLVEGHADDIGGIFHNRHLSEQRSQSTAEYLKHSSDLIEVTIKSYGEEKPVSNNETALGRQLNRRVKLKIQGVPYQSPLNTFLVKPGTTIDMILGATGLVKQDIVTWNGLSGEELKPYQPVRLPADLDYNTVKHLLYYLPKPHPANENSDYHTVQHGENLYKLSLQYSTTVEMLEKLNNLNDSELKAGQQIRVR